MTPEQLQQEIASVRAQLEQARQTVASLEARLSSLQKELEAAQAQPTWSLTPEGTGYRVRFSGLPTGDHYRLTMIDRNGIVVGGGGVWLANPTYLDQGVRPGDRVRYRAQTEDGANRVLAAITSPVLIAAPSPQPIPTSPPSPAPQPNGQSGARTLPQLSGSVIVPGVLCGLHNCDHPDGSTDAYMHPFMVDKYTHEYLRPTWAQLEPKQGVYDWAPIDAALAGAKSRGRTLGLGITPFMERFDFSATPSYIPRQNGMLDWNSETYVQAQIALWKALGNRYRDNPWLEWVDARGWGPYGENNNYPNVNPPMTLANKKRIIEAMFLAFPPSSRVLLLAMTDDAESTDYMIQQAIQLGVRWKVGKRRDSYSNREGPKPWGFNWYDEDGRPQTTVEQWKYAPFLVENWGPFNNFADQDYDKAFLASQQFHISAYKDQNHGHIYSEWTGHSRQMWERVLTEQAGYRLTVLELSQEGNRLGLKWQNSGNAPLYRDYRVELVLVDGAGNERVTRSTVNLRNLMPGDTLTVTDTLSAPVGTYQLRLRAVDMAGVRQPLQFALRDRRSDGSYDLGSISLN